MNQQIKNILILLSITLNIFVGYFIYELQKFDKKVDEELVKIRRGDVPIANINGQSMKAWEWVTLQIGDLRKQLDEKK